MGLGLGLERIVLVDKVREVMGVMVDLRVFKGILVFIESRILSLYEY